MAARVAEMEEENIQKPAAKVSQAKVLTDDMAKKMDQLLAGMSKMESQVANMYQRNLSLVSVTSVDNRAILVGIV